jgi:hypothetical protein
MQIQTTEFFTKGGICFFRLRTYEDKDDVIMNVTFTQTQGAEAFMIYKTKGKKDYVEERIDLASG